MINKLINRDDWVGDEWDAPNSNYLNIQDWLD